MRYESTQRVEDNVTFYSIFYYVLASVKDDILTIPLKVKFSSYTMSAKHIVCIITKNKIVLKMGSKLWKLEKLLGCYLHLYQYFVVMEKRLKHVLKV